VAATAVEVLPTSVPFLASLNVSEDPRLVDNVAPELGEIVLITASPCGRVGKLSGTAGEAAGTTVATII
jgi:hypothetical protein